MGTTAFIAILVMLAVGLHLFVNANPKVLAAKLRRPGAWALIAGAIFFTLRGQFVLAVPLLAMAIWMLGSSGLLGRILSDGAWSGTKSSGQKSRVRTQVLEMELDHDSGEMAGYVLTGTFAGRELSDLNTAELLELLLQCDEAGDQSTALLEAYMDRAEPDWREKQGEGTTRRQQSSTGSTAITRDEAYEILGLSPGASQEEIRKAHKSLMKSFHPDQGGSGYLAAKINQAKDLLLG